MVDTTGPRSAHYARPTGLPGVEVAFAEPARRTFAVRASDTLGICLKIGDGHAVHADGVERFYPAGALCVRPPGCVWTCTTGRSGFLSLDLAPSLLGERPLPATMLFGSASAVPAFAARLSAIVRARSPLVAEQLVLDVIDDLGQAGALRRESVPTGTGAIARAREYIAEHATSGPRLDEIAAAAGVSTFALIRAFRRHTGTTPHRYVVLHQLHHAREQIARGRPLADAAVSAGFADQSHLSRWFRRIHQTTPGEYFRTLRRPPVNFVQDVPSVDARR